MRLTAVSPLSAYGNKHLASQLLIYRGRQGAVYHARVREAFGVTLSIIVPVPATNGVDRLALCVLERLLLRQSRYHAQGSLEPLMISIFATRPTTQILNNSLVFSYRLPDSNHHEGSNVGESLLHVATHIFFPGEQLPDLTQEDLFCIASQYEKIAESTTIESLVLPEEFKSIKDAPLKIANNLQLSKRLHDIAITYHATYIARAPLHVLITSPSDSAPKNLFAALSEWSMRPQTLSGIEEVPVGKTQPHGQSSLKAAYLCGIAHDRVVPHTESQILPSMFSSTPQINVGPYYVENLTRNMHTNSYTPEGLVRPLFHRIDSTLICVAFTVNNVFQADTAAALCKWIIQPGSAMSFALQNLRNSSNESILADVFFDSVTFSYKRIDRYYLLCLHMDGVPDAYMEVLGGHMRKGLWISIQEYVTNPTNVASALSFLRNELNSLLYRCETNIHDALLEDISDFAHPEIREYFCNFCEPSDIFGSLELVDIASPFLLTDFWSSLSTSASGTRKSLSSESLGQYPPSKDQSAPISSFERYVARRSDASADKGKPMHDSAHHFGHSILKTHIVEDLESLKNSGTLTKSFALTVVRKYGRYVFPAMVSLGHTIRSLHLLVHCQKDIGNTLSSISKQLFRTSTWTIAFFGGTNTNPFHSVRRIASIIPNNSMAHLDHEGLGCKSLTISSYLSHRNSGSQDTADNTHDPHYKRSTGSCALRTGSKETSQIFAAVDLGKEPLRPQECDASEESSMRQLFGDKGDTELLSSVFLPLVKLYQGSLVVIPSSNPLVTSVKKTHKKLRSDTDQLSQMSEQGPIEPYSPSAGKKVEKPDYERLKLTEYTHYSLFRIPSLVTRLPHILKHQPNSNVEEHSIATDSSGRASDAGSLGFELTSVIRSMQVVNDLFLGQKKKKCVMCTFVSTSEEPNASVTYSVPYSPGDLGSTVISSPSRASSSFSTVADDDIVRSSFNDTCIPHVTRCLANLVVPIVSSDAHSDDFSLTTHVLLKPLSADEGKMHSDLMSLESNQQDSKAVSLRVFGDRGIIRGCSSYLIAQNANAHMNMDPESMIVMSNDTHGDLAFLRNNQLLSDSFQANELFNAAFCTNTTLLSDSMVYYDPEISVSLRLVLDLSFLPSGSHNIVYLIKNILQRKAGSDSLLFDVSATGLAITISAISVAWFVEQISRLISIIETVAISPTDILSMVDFSCSQNARAIVRTVMQFRLVLAQLFSGVKIAGNLLVSVDNCALLNSKVDSQHSTNYLSIKNRLFNRAFDHIMSTLNRLFNMLPRYCAAVSISTSDPIRICQAQHGFPNSIEATKQVATCLARTHSLVIFNTSEIVSSLMSKGNIDNFPQFRDVFSVFCSLAIAECLKQVVSSWNCVDTVSASFDVASSSVILDFVLSQQDPELIDSIHYDLLTRNGNLSKTLSHMRKGARLQLACTSAVHLLFEHSQTLPPEAPDYVLSIIDAILGALKEYSLAEHAMLFVQLPPAISDVDVSSLMPFVSSFCMLTTRPYDYIVLEPPNLPASMCANTFTNLSMSIITITRAYLSGITEGVRNIVTLQQQRASDVSCMRRNSLSELLDTYQQRLSERLTIVKRVSELHDMFDKERTVGTAANLVSLSQMLDQRKRYARLLEQQISSLQLRNTEMQTVDTRSEISTITDNVGHIDNDPLSDNSQFTDSDNPAAANTTHDDINVHSTMSRMKLLGDNPSERMFLRDASSGCRISNRTIKYLIDVDLRKSELQRQQSAMALYIVKLFSVTISKKVYFLNGMPIVCHPPVTGDSGTLPYGVFKKSLFGHQLFHSLIKPSSHIFPFLNSNVRYCLRNKINVYPQETALWYYGLIVKYLARIFDMPLRTPILDRGLHTSLSLCYARLPYPIISTIVHGASTAFRDYTMSHNSKQFIRTWFGQTFTSNKVAQHSDVSLVGPVNFLGQDVITADSAFQMNTYLLAENLLGLASALAVDVPGVPSSDPVEMLLSFLQSLSSRL